MAAQEYYRMSRESMSGGRSGRNHSPDYAYAGGAGPAYSPGGQRIPSPGHTAYMGSATGSASRQLPYYPPPPGGGLQVPENHRARPRSLPPGYGRRNSSWDGRGERGDNRHGDSDDSDDGLERRERALTRTRDQQHRDRTPVGKAKEALDKTFTTSTTGLGVGVLGALLGGLVAREATDRVTHHGHDEDDRGHRRNQVLSTMVGAAVGALGANAIEKRLEVNRAEDRVEDEEWNRRWRPETLRNGEVIERREVVARPRSSNHHRAIEDGGHRRDRDRDWDDRDGRRSSRRSDGTREREVDPDARSWRNVEDWVYDERDNRDGRRRGDDYRY